MKFGVIMAALCGAAATQAGELYAKIERYNKQYNNYGLYQQNPYLTMTPQAMTLINVAEQQAPQQAPPQQLITDEPKDTNAEDTKPATLSKARGAIEILIGIFICFCGANMIKETVNLILFICIAAGLIKLMAATTKVGNDYNDNDTKTMALFGLGYIVVSAILTSILSKKFVTKPNILRLIGGSCAAIGCNLIIVGIEMSDQAKHTSVLVAFILGVLFCCCLGSRIITYGTSFIGAFLMMHGLGYYLGGFPPMTSSDLQDEKLSNKFIGYIAGIILLTIASGCRQMNTMTESDQIMLWYFNMSWDLPWK